jgi:hypothetical protein
MAATERRSGAVRPGAIAAAAVVLAVLMGSVPLIRNLDIDTVFLTPVQEAVARVFPDREALGLAGFSRRDFLGYTTLAAGLLLALAWRRAPQLRAPLTIGLGAALQVAIGLYGWAVTDGKVADVGSRTANPPTFASLGWVDRSPLAGQRPVLAANLVGAQAPPMLAAYRRLSFFNDDLGGFAFIPALGLPLPPDPIPALDALYYDLDPETGRLAGPRVLDAIVDHPGSPGWQLAGSDTVASGADQAFVMRRAAVPNRLIWSATGLTSDGWVVAGKPVPLRIYPGAVKGHAVHVKMVITPPPVSETTRMTLRLGSYTNEMIFRVGQTPTELSFELCLGRRPITGELTPVQTAPGPPGAPDLAAAVTFVELSPTPSC